METELNTIVTTKIQEYINKPKPTNEIVVRLLNYANGEIGVVVNKLIIKDKPLIENGSKLDETLLIPEIIDKEIFSSVRVQKNNNKKGGNKNMKTKKVIQKIIPSNHLYTSKHYK